MGLLKKHNLKELNSEQKGICSEISEIIIANTDSIDWVKDETISKYIESPIHDNQERLQEIDSVAYNHQISNYLSSILVASKKD